MPIDGPEAENLIKAYSFFAADEIPDGAYKGVTGVKTVSVNAIWATSSKQPDQLIYSITAALWNPSTRSCSIPATPRAGRSSSRRRRGPRHPAACGAEKFYKEKGLIK